MRTNSFTTLVLHFTHKSIYSYTLKNPTAGPVYYWITFASTASTLCMVLTLL